MPEQIEKSLESQIQMARPKRAEVKQVPLTPEEKEFLGEIMDKAVAAEKAGKLKEALDFYIDYKNELSKIKDRQEEEKKQEEQKKSQINIIKEGLEAWSIEIDAPRYFIEDNFELSKLPNLETKGHLDLRDKHSDKFPADMTVNGNLNLFSTNVNEWSGTRLNVKGELNMRCAKIKYLPKILKIGKDFDISESSIKDLPDDLYIGGDIWLSGCSDNILEKAKKLKEEGKIKGRIRA